MSGIFSANLQQISLYIPSIFTDIKKITVIQLQSQNIFSWVLSLLFILKFNHTSHDIHTHYIQSATDRAVFAWCQNTTDVEVNLYSYKTINIKYATATCLLPAVLSPISRVK